MSQMPGLRDWQQTALQSWEENDFHGCFEVATGGGKTTFALAAFNHLRENIGNINCLVVVPTTALLDQWFLAFQDDLGIPTNDIKVLSGKNLNADGLVNLVIINTARAFNNQYISTEPLFQIVDECHRAGSAENAKALLPSARATMGLSATPQREFDEGFETHVIPALGKVLISYPLEDAIRDGVLSKLSLTYVKIPLLPTEQHQYDDLTKKIARSMAVNNVEAATSLLRKRSRLSNEAFYRLPVMFSVLQSNRGRRTLVFVESIASAEGAKKLLDESGHSTTIYHSQMGTAIRRANLRGFRKGIFDVLIACRALDEGFNVPEAELAVIVAGTASKRQRIQRVGRVLRSMADKEHGEVVTLYATPAEETRLLREAALLQANTTINWIEASHE